MRTAQQFSIRQLMLLVVTVSIVLALATQLGASGVIASGYVLVLAIGLGLRRWNLAAAAATGLVIFAVTLLALWTQLGYEKTMNQRSYYFAELVLDLIEEEVRLFEKENGRLPERMQECPNLSPYFDSDWRGELTYRRTPDGFEVRFTRNGQEGPGMTLKEIRNAAFDHPLTLRQFLFESMLSFAMILTALLASLVAAGLWLGAGWVAPLSWKSAAISFAVTAIAAGLVAFLLAAMHLVLSQGSGH